MENWSFGCPTRSDTNQPVQSQIKAGSLKFRKKRTYKALISFAVTAKLVTAKLICAFVFA